MPALAPVGPAPGLAEGPERRPLRARPNVVDAKDHGRILRAERARGRGDGRLAVNLPAIEELVRRVAAEPLQGPIAA